MNGLIQAATVLLPTAYLAAAVLFGMAFAGDRAPLFAERMRSRILGATLLLHAGVFAARVRIAETFPIDGAWLFEWTDPVVPEGWHSRLSKERGTVVYIHA